MCTESKGLSWATDLNCVYTPSLGCRVESGSPQSAKQTVNERVGLWASLLHPNSALGPEVGGKAGAPTLTQLHIQTP